jgi:fibronectin type 3 domain-containing protein
MWKLFLTMENPMGNQANVRALIKPAFAGAALIMIASIMHPIYAAGAARPLVAHGTLLTADGKLLRGMPLNIGRQNPAAVNAWGTTLSNLRNFRDQLHQNCVRICFFDGRYVPSKNESAAITMNEVISYTDAIVNNAESLGIYVIIDYHSGLEAINTTSPWNPKTWWGTLAPRYKDKTWVMYELLNEPCGDPPGPTSPDAAIYKIIRAVAPATPILHISTMQIASSWTSALKNLALVCGFNWSDGKDVFGYHTYAGSQAKFIKELQTANIPSICTEWGYAEDPWGPATLDGYVRESEWFERNCMSWIDWHDWWIANPLDHGLNLLIPDALAKGYAWWTNSAPSAPRNLAVQTPDPYRATLTWGKPSSAGAGIVRYIIYRNDREVAASTDTAFSDTGLLAAATYAYEVSALGVGGLESPRSTRVSVTTSVDNTAPAIAAISGAGDGRIVRLVFSEPVEQTSAQTAANYGIDKGIAVSLAVLATDRKTVTLTTSLMTRGATYTLTVNNVLDRATVPNSASNVKAPFTCFDGITKIRFFPRPGYGARMAGGVFEGTNGAPDAGPYTTLCVLPVGALPTGWAETYTFVNFDAGYRYVRYRSPAQSWGNVAEIEFWSGSTKATGTPFGTAGANGGNDFSKAFDGNITTFFDCTQADGAYAGLDISGWSPVAVRTTRKTAGAPDLVIKAYGSSMMIDGAGNGAEVFDIRGAMVRAASRPAGNALVMGAPAQGVYVLRARSSMGESVRLIRAR